MKRIVFLMFMFIIVMGCNNADTPSTAEAEKAYKEAYKNRLVITKFEKTNGFFEKQTGVYYMDVKIEANIFKKGTSCSGETVVKLLNKEKGWEILSPTPPKGCSSMLFEEYNIFKDSKPLKFKRDKKGGIKAVKPEDPEYNEIK